MAIARRKAADVFTLPNGDVVTLIPGMPVTNVLGVVKRGNATSLGTSTIIGLIVTGNAVTLPVTIRSTGPLILTTAQWDAVTGLVGGLVPGVDYYLDLITGQVTTTAPIIDGQSVTRIGEALNSTTMLVNPEPPVFL